MNIMIRYLNYVCRLKGIDLSLFYRVQISRRHITLVGNSNESLSTLVGGDDVMITRYINIYLT